MSKITREGLAENLWPDKTMYGCLLLFVAGLLGSLFALVNLVTTVSYTQRIPAVLTSVPPALSLVLSLAAMGVGFVAWQKLRADWGVAGAVAGVASLGLVGFTSVFSAIALAFLVDGIREGEHESEYTARLEPEHWPDKTLAASLLALMHGVVLIGWAAGIGLGEIEFTLIPGQSILTALVAGIAGVALLEAARRLYHQQDAAIGAAATLVGMVTVGLYVVGPLLGLGTLAAIWLAWREEEFEGHRDAQAA